MFSLTLFIRYKMLCYLCMRQSVDDLPHHEVPHPVHLPVHGPGKYENCISEIVPYVPT